MLNGIHPPRPDWYEEFYASALETSMKSYEAEFSTHIFYKSQLFTSLKGKAKTLLEIGIGTGLNLKYYGSDNGVSVFGIDANRKMEKFAKAVALNVGLPPVMRVLKPGGIYRYVFVEHVAAKDGTILRFVQGVLDPLQQTVADGCHFTRKTGKNISEVGFSRVNINTAFLFNASLINPHVYGIACK